MARGALCQLRGNHSRWRAGGPGAQARLPESLDTCRQGASATAARTGTPHELNATRLYQIQSRCWTALDATPSFSPPSRICSMYSYPRCGKPAVMVVVKATPFVCYVFLTTTTVPCDMVAFHRQPVIRHRQPRRDMHSPQSTR